MDEPIAFFITWSTYGTWLPGDSRGWRKWRAGDQPPQPRLEAWCRRRMRGNPVVLSPCHRAVVEQACRDHAAVRRWLIHAINVRTNHVHVVITATNMRPQMVRDQLKANATRKLREADSRFANKRVWARGGDCQIVDTEDELEQVVLYILEAQDRWPRQ
ncbi:MAG: hypothetical protein GXP27_14095 [Planctomycetes bacterium]|nr:hypothetical protein [Planctomycetota bacterium]